MSSTSNTSKDLLRRLKARLSAAGMVLESAPAEAKSAMSDIQARAVLKLISELQEIAPMSDETCADVSILASRVAWAGPWLVTILDHLNQRPKEPARDARGQNRRANQPMMPALLSYFTPTEWNVLLATSVPAHVRMEKVYQRMLQLNLRNPTERCIKELASWMLVMEFGEERAWLTSMPQRASTQDEVRSASGSSISPHQRSLARRTPRRCQVCPETSRSSTPRCTNAPSRQKSQCRVACGFR